MTKVSRCKAVSSILGLFALSASGCVTGSLEGDEDYLKICVERHPSPDPPRCQKLTPSAVKGSDVSAGWLYLPYQWDDELASFLDRAREGPAESQNVAQK
jgi:hypothetical protein